MNRTEAGFLATREALGHMERSMFALHREKAKYHPTWYAAMAEPTVEEILKLRAEIDEYIGLAEFAPGGRMLNPSPPNPELPPLGAPPAGVNGEHKAADPAQTQPAG